MFLCCCRLSSVRTAVTVTMRVMMTTMLLRESSSWYSPLPHAIIAGIMIDKCGNFLVT